MKIFTLIILKLVIQNQPSSSLIDPSSLPGAKNFTINNEKCFESSCKLQGDGNQYCSWKNNDNKLFIMMCKPPQDQEQVSRQIDELKSVFLKKLNSWKSTIEVEASTQDEFSGKYTSLNLTHMNLQGKLDTIAKMQMKTSKMVQDMLDYQTKFKVISKEIQDIKDWIKAYAAKLADGKKSGNTTDCTGMQGQQGEGAGDGLNVHQQTNEVFRGDSISGRDHHIDHVWPSISPHPELNANNFSVRWVGFLTVPKTGTYTLTLDTDCGGVLKLNGDIAIHDRISLKDITNWNKWKNTNMEKALKEGKFFDVADIDAEWEHKNTSEPVEMFIGQFYDIEVLYTHTVHDSQLGLNSAYIHLQWESMDLKKQAIPGFYYYRNIVEPVSLIFEQDKSIVELDDLFDNKDAFFDSKEWRTSDVPTQLQGISWLKSIRYFQFKYIEFKAMSNVTVQVAVDWTESNPLELGWSRTDLEMSILKVDDMVQDELMNKGIATAAEQVDFAIQRRDFFKGDIRINFRIGDGDYRNLMIFAVPNLLMKNQSCGGGEIFLSNSGDETSLQSGCEASSSLDQESFSCVKGTGSGYWKADNEGVGSFIIIRFKDLVYPTHVEITNDAQWADMNKAVRIWQNDARHYDITLRQTQEPQKLPVKNATQTDYIKLEVKQVQGTNNNGFNVKIWGLRCVDEDEIRRKDDIEMKRFSDDRKVILKCSSTLATTIGINRKVGSKTPLYCEESCKTQIYDRIQGNEQTWSSDSSLCRAAQQSGIIGEDGGDLVVEWGRGVLKFEPGPAKDELAPEPRDDPDSASAILHKLLSADEEAKLDWTQGEPVDFKHESTCWTRATIDSLEKGKGETRITIKIGSESVALVQPSKEFEWRVGKCGSKQPSEPCEKSHPVKVEIPNVKESHDATSFRGGDCQVNPENCIFEDQELAQKPVKCENEFKMMKINKNSNYKKLICMSKCLKVNYEKKDDCDLVCPGICSKVDQKQQCLNEN